jgi:hypothetical protein
MRLPCSPAISQCGQVAQQRVAIPRRMGRAVGAQQDQIGAQILHHQNLRRIRSRARALDGVKPS